ncbi:MAG: zinc metalloprotease [Myxococcales bacterium]|nr:zinc metalloprotease [Myxococcales bacterium]
MEMTANDRCWLYLLPALLLGCDAAEQPETLTVVASPQTEEELLGACLLADDDNACTGLDRLADAGATRRCGVERTPEQVAATEREFADWLAAAPEQPSALAPQSVYVPVAIHVINKGPGVANGDVTEAQIEDQMAVLNMSHWGQTGGPKTPFVFFVYSIDRTTNPSWYTMSIGSSHETAAKTALHRGAEGMLNLYIVQPYNGIAGWSTMPSDYFYAPLMDGVVIDNRTLPGGGSVAYGLGDNAVHEIGHWLGLFHTFEGGCGKNDVYSGDKVADTPAEKSPAYGCPKSRDSCNSEGKDPVNNFMDYTDDSCMNAFTPGQIMRMEHYWTVYRD